MALPGSGYNPHRVDYFISSDVGLAYNGGTAYTVIVNKSFAGDTTPTSV